MKGSLIVRLRVRGGIKPVTPTRSGAVAAMTRDVEWITVTVPRIPVYEAIRVDLA